MLKKWILKHDRGVQRALEILPGLVSWNVILFPWWGILIIPNAVAYFILFFNIYWLYQSLQTAVGAIVANVRIQASIGYDWKADLKSFPDWQKVKHLVIIPTYKEPQHILERTLKSLADQDLPLKQLLVVLAMEENEDVAVRRSKTKILNSKFKNTFGQFFITVHKLLPGEAAGKASNEKYAVLWVKKHFLSPQKVDLNYLTVTSCDADHKFHPKHFSYLTFKFLDDPKRYLKFWQAAILFYNNIW